MIFALTTLLAADPAVSEVVIVRGERLRTQQGRASGIIVSGQALQDQVGVRLDETLRIVPGIGLFRRTPSGAANATIQGLSLRPIAPNGAGRALVILDGVPQNDPFGGWIYWGRYDPAFLSSVEIKRGGAGAGFGPLALTGVLDLAEARGNATSATISAGSFGAVHGAGRYALGSQEAMFTAMIVHDRSDGTFALTPTNRGSVDQKLFTQMTAATMVTDIARPNGAWSFRVSGFAEEKGGGVVGGASAAQGLDISAARRIEGEWGQARMIVFAQARDFSNQAVAVAAGRAIATPSLDQFSTPSSALGASLLVDGEGLVRVALDWRRSEGETRELFRYIGAGFTRTRVAGGQQDVAGISVAPRRPLDTPLGMAGGRLRFDGLVRLDHWTNRNARRLETDRATGLATLNEQATDKDGAVATGHVTALLGPFNLSAYRTFRPPSLNELHRPFRVGNDVTEANADLKPETLTGLDLGWRFTSPISGGGLTVEATLYANRLYGPITNLTLASGPGTFARVGFLPAGGALRERRNVGRIDAAGLEAQIGWRSDASRVSGALGLALTHARVQGGSIVPQLTGKRPAQSPSWSGAVNIGVPLDGQQSLSMTLRGEGSKYEDDLNVRQLPAYGALDMRYEHRLAKAATLFVSVENALDQGVATARAGDGLVNYTQGRVVRVGLTVRH
jgi:outer membrane cobalamin receptor